MMTATTRQVPPDAADERVVQARAGIVYTLLGDLRYISHHDELRMLSRALIRARWPIAYSRGFNPSPKISIALPRPLGTESLCQLAVVGLSRDVDGADSAARLGAALPSGCTLLRVIMPAPAATAHARAACYEIRLMDGDAPSDARIAALLARDSVVVSRASGPSRPPRNVDIRPYIKSIETEGRLLRVGLTFDQQRSARPLEVLQELGVCLTEYRHRIRLVDVEWNHALWSPDGLTTAQEGSGFGEKGQEDDAQTRRQEGQEGGGG